MEKLKIKAYKDSSFAYTEDCYSHIAYIVFLYEDSFGHVINFSSTKSKRIIRSVLEGEACAFADEFDCLFTLKHDLQSMIATNIPIHMIKDSKSLFDIITEQ